MTWREARYQDDMREGLELRIALDDQGDVYVSVLPVGHKIGPTVRLCASGGADNVSGLLPALRAAHAAMARGRARAGDIPTVDEMLAAEERAARAEAERDALRLELEAVRVHSARHQRERDDWRAGYEEMTRWRDGALDEHRKATEALAAERARREEVERERDGAMEEARAAREAVGEEHRRRLADETRHREVERQTAAMREALEEYRRAPARVSLNQWREMCDRALSGDAGRGALLPTGTPGRVAVEVVDGFAVQGVPVWVMTDAALVGGNVMSWYTIDDTWVVFGDVGHEFEPEHVYLDRSRCIRDAVRALDLDRRERVVMRVLCDEDRERWRWNKLATSDAIAAADPDGLLLAYQAVCAAAKVAR